MAERSTAKAPGDAGQSCKREPRSYVYGRGRAVTGRTLLAMLTFVGIVAAIMWFFVLPAVAGIKPTLP